MRQSSNTSDALFERYVRMIFYAPIALTSESLVARQLWTGGSGLPLRTPSRRMTLPLPHRLHASGREFDTVRQARQ
jgi:hypothetical protein